MHDACALSIQQSYCLHLFKSPSDDRVLRSSLGFVQVWYSSKLRRLMSTIQHSVTVSTVSLSCIAGGSFSTLPLRFEEQCEICGLLLAGWKDQRGLHCITLCITADQKIHVVCGQIP